MKSNKILKSIFAVAMGAMVMTGCTDNATGGKDSLKLSGLAYTFLGEGNTPQTITVTASTAWTVEPSESWVVIDEKTENSVVIYAEDSDELFERKATLYFKAGDASREYTVTQLPKGNNKSRYRDLSAFGMIGAAISPNGKYAGGAMYDVDPITDNPMYLPVIIDVETDEWHYLPAVVKSRSYSVSNTTTLTDNGMILFYDGYNGGCFFIDKANNYIKPQAPVGFKYPNAQVEQTAADGTIWVGYGTKTTLDGWVDNGDGYRPLRWENTEPQELPLPELNFRNNRPWGGCQVRGVSSDGEVMYGSQWEDDARFEDYVAVIWTRNASGEFDVEFMGGLKKDTDEPIHKVTENVEFEDADGKYVVNLANGLLMAGDNLRISPNGKWIASTWRTETKTGTNEITNGYYPAFYNTETKETTVLDGFVNRMGISVTDDGIAVIGNTNGTKNNPPSAGTVVDLNSGATLGSCYDWIAKQYGINVSSGVILYISPNAETAYGTKMASLAGSAISAFWYITTPKK